MIRKFNWRLKPQKTESETKIQHLVDKMLLNPDLKKYRNPLTGECIIRTPDLQVCIIIGSGTIDILNHDYLIRKDILMSLTDEFKELVIQAIAADVEAVRSELLENEINLLNRLEEKL